ncbi:MAG TPA: response regulator [Nitrospiria bacterium]|jgi:DNA-binding response OmpR family regulator|nr:response regulator [Nitrospiria bacterium]
MGHPRILVIDDEENFLNLLSKILGKEGYEVRATFDGKQALGWFEQEPFDLVLADIRMQPMDGFSVLERIKSLRPDTKVIMMTAYPSESTRTLAFLKGAADYMVKPFNINELTLLIRRQLLPP